MKRGMQTDRLDSLDAPNRKSRKRRVPILLILLLLFAVTVAALPRLLVNRSVVLAAVERFGGLKPLQVDFTGVRAGWFAPAALTGLKIADENGVVLVEIGSIDSEKGLLSWITSGNDLGTIRLRDVVMDIESHAGSTNIERALEHLITATPTEQPTDTTQVRSATTVTGKIEIAAGKIRLRDRGNVHPWLLAVEKLSIDIPRSGQLVGPIQLQAMVHSLKPGDNQAGAVTAEISQTDLDGGSGLALRAAVNMFPLAVWQALSPRLPDVPIGGLNGSLSGQVAGSYLDLHHWSIELPRVLGREMHLDAPDFLGEQPLQLAELALAGRCSFNGKQVALSKVQLSCDAGSVNADGQLPWPLTLPSVAQPWLADAVIDASGSLDVARLVAAAPTLVPMKAGTKLQSGNATFHLVQNFAEASQPRCQVELQLAGLAAVAAGQHLKWDEPLKMNASAGPQPNGAIQFTSQIVSEFCDVSGSGNAQQGSFAGKVNLDRLQQRVAQWIELPIKAMSGAADMNIVWNQSPQSIVKLNGKFTTTPLAVTMSSGGELREPAWNGAIDATARIVGAQLKQLENGRIDLKSEQEALQFELLEPFVLASSNNSASPATAAGFKVTLRGDIANWQRRAAVFQFTVPDTRIAGNVELQTGGRFDLAHLELSDATWKFEPFEVATSTMTLAESQLVGTFKGRVDTADLTRLAVEKLEVRATAFSLGAADSPASNPKDGRIGRAAFLVDLARLMNNVREGTLPNAIARSSTAKSSNGLSLVSAPTQTRLALAGRMQGELAWQINSQEAVFNLKTSGENIEALSQSTRSLGTTAPTQPLWREPSIVASVDGRWLISANSLQVPKLDLQVPWFHFLGNMDYTPATDSQSATLKGQCLYDAAQVAQKLHPWIGDHVQLVGKKTVPVDVKWTAKTGQRESSLAGLQAATRIGWDQARVVGIQVGTADVPVSITNGRLATAAEIPVSGGVLRWDVTGDLASDEMLIVQKPMTVLDNVAITPEMCESWLKYVAPLVAQATAVEGRLSMKLNEATLNPMNPRSQLVDGQLIMHNAEVGPGPLSNQIIGLVQQVNAIRKQDFSQVVGNQKSWLKMPEQNISFRMENGQVAHKHLNVHIGDANISTSGAVDIDGRMDLMAEMPIPDDWVAKSPFLASLRGKSLQFPVRGTLTGPQLDTQLLTQIGRDTVQQAAQGLIQRELQRGLGKLFGAPPAPQGTPNQ